MSHNIREGTYPSDPNRETNSDTNSQKAPESTRSSRPLLSPRPPPYPTPREGAATQSSPTALGATRNGFNNSSSVYPAVRPNRQRSALVTNAGRYKPADEAPANESFVPNRSFCPFPQAQASRGSFMHPIPAADEGDIFVDAPPHRNISFIAPLNRRQREQVEQDDPINNYTFMVDAVSDSDDESEGGATIMTNSSALPLNLPSNTNSSFLRVEDAAAMAADMRRNREHNEPFDNDDNDELGRRRLARTHSEEDHTDPLGQMYDDDEEEEMQKKKERHQPRVRFQVASSASGDTNDAASLERQRKKEEEEEVEALVDEHERLPLPTVLRVKSCNNLDDDTVSFTAVYQSIMSELPITNIFFSLRVTLLCVFPMFLLIEHPKTANWFVGSSLLPIMAGLFMRQTLGMQVFMTALALESAIVFLLIGTVMNSVGLIHHQSAWWCAVIFFSFVLGCFGDHPAKRLMMMYAIIILQMEHMPGGDTLTYPSYFFRDFIIATALAQVAAFIPWPVLSTNVAEDLFVKLHMLYAAGVGNAMKSYFAPVTLDAKMAVSQMPFVKIRALTGGLKVHMHFSTYEPFSFFSNRRYYRGERLAILQRIKVHLYAMTAASHQKIAASEGARNRGREVKELLQRIQRPAMELASEVIEILKQLGPLIDPDDVVDNINYEGLYNKRAILIDILDRERTEMLFLKRLTRDDTNAYNSCFAFLNGIIDIADEVAKIENAARNTDNSKYPSSLSRMVNFFFLDNWKSFWEVLPRVLTLRTPADVRIVKDSIRYTGAFAVACAFTLNYDHNKVYYFGMAILVRLAQQTAAETINVGIFRICGLCIGASLGTITVQHTNNLPQRVAMTMLWVFVSMCFSQSPTYQWGAQYVMIICITSQRLAVDPGLLMNRVIDNVFAFISYFIICEVLFPVDPIRVLWNIRTKIFIACNDLVQSFVVLGSAPITRSGEEVKFIMNDTKAELAALQGMLVSYTEWAGKAATEPTLRGGVYPHPAVMKVLLFSSEIASLLEVMHHAVALMHRPREHEPSQLIVDQMEVMRPFFLDAGKITYKIFQLLVDATERPLEWRLEEPLQMLYRAKLAVNGAMKLTGNIQRNFYAAAHQLSNKDKHQMNQYQNSSFVADAVRQGNLAVLEATENEEIMQRIYAMSFHMSNDKLLPRDDVQAFCIAVSGFSLLLKTLWQLLEPMVDIYEWEKSRVTVVNPLTFIKPKFIKC